jgi:endonuclease YncB( thermonuclease family)
LPENSKFTITKPSLDQYKRILGEVINANGINVNAEMTKVGMAARYPFQSGCTAYKNYESVAKQAQLGLWSVENFCMPWNYRQNKCS